MVNANITGLINVDGVRWFFSDQRLSSGQPRLVLGTNRAVCVLDKGQQKQKSKTKLTSKFTEAAKLKAAPPSEQLSESPALVVTSWNQKKILSDGTFKKKEPSSSTVPTGHRTGLSLCIFLN